MPQPSHSQIRSESVKPSLIDPQHEQVFDDGIQRSILTNIHYDAERTRLATNVELVQRLVRISREFERPLASCAQARSMIGLNP